MSTKNSNVSLFLEKFALSFLLWEQAPTLNIQYTEAEQGTMYNVHIVCMCVFYPYNIQISELTFLAIRNLELIMKPRVFVGDL